MKYVIEIEDEPIKYTNIHRAKGFKTLVFNEYGLSLLTPYDQQYQKDLERWKQNHRPRKSIGEEFERLDARIDMNEKLLCECIEGVKKLEESQEDSDNALTEHAERLLRLEQRSEALAKRVSDLEGLVYEDMAKYNQLSDRLSDEEERSIDYNARLTELEEKYDHDILMLEDRIKALERPKSQPTTTWHYDEPNAPEEEDEDKAYREWCMKKVEK